MSDDNTKSFSTMAALYAFRGWQLWRSDADDGVVRYFAARWGRVHVLADMVEVHEFLIRIGGRTQ